MPESVTKTGTGDVDIKHFEETLDLTKIEVVPN